MLLAKLNWKFISFCHFLYSFDIGEQWQWQLIQTQFQGLEKGQCSACIDEYQGHMERVFFDKDCCCRRSSLFSTISKNICLRIAEILSAYKVQKRGLYKSRRKKSHCTKRRRGLSQNHSFKFSRKNDKSLRRKD